MSVLSVSDPQDFGVRLRHLRKVRGLTQIKLGALTGISNRVVHYYEVQGGTPSPEMVKRFAKALGVVVGQLVGPAGLAGITPADIPHTNGELALWRKFRQIRRLPPQQRRAVFRAMDQTLKALQPSPPVRLKYPRNRGVRA